MLSPPAVEPGTRYELASGEEAPIVAIRRLLELKLSDPIPPVSVKLGTTRGTNALLTRRGARTAFVTTRGFADVLLIGNQDRPRLFDLAIHRPAPLFEHVVEIDERIAADGSVLIAADPIIVRRQMHDAQSRRASNRWPFVCCTRSRIRRTKSSSSEQRAKPGFRNQHFEQTVATDQDCIPRRHNRDGRILEPGPARTSPNCECNCIVGRARLPPSCRMVLRHPTKKEAPHPTPPPRGGRGSAKRMLMLALDLESRASRLKIMTSAGGLVDAGRFVGKDSILSGPAGGVIGYSRVAQRAGFAKSIGFDMGGTSTDVSRFDGRYELEFETQKAGVRVVAPMLAIETVAAGGGSICGFDGVRLFVGPDSAGADPGPACYGRGGPLTVTDLNLFLGKILPSRFPFELDCAAVERRLQRTLRSHRRFADGTTLHAGRTRRRVSANRQCQHGAARSAKSPSLKATTPPIMCWSRSAGPADSTRAPSPDELGMRQILIHPYAGILSAYGIGLADVRRFGERSVLEPYSAATLARLEPIFAELEAAAVAEVAAEGVEPAHIQPPVRWLDMRYRGIEATINVPQSRLTANYAAELRTTAPAALRLSACRARD